MSALAAALSFEKLGAKMDRFFPPPTFLYPRAAGIDISDASIKWMTLGAFGALRGRLESSGEVPLSPGIVEGGIVRDIPALGKALASVVPHLGGITAAHAALPEEAAYVFSMHVPEGAPYEQMLPMIEFEFNGRVPIPPASTVFDFNVIQERDGAEGTEIGVVVFPRDVSEAYAVAFEAAGITLLSLELEARSIARAISSEDAHEPITLLVDFGRMRSGVAVLKRGVPIFTSTIEIGGDAVAGAVQKALNVDYSKAETFINEQGLIAQGSASAGMEALIGTASALSDEIARHYHYWDTRRNERDERMTPVGKIVLVGGSANLRGLPEYIASRVQAPVEYGNIWRHAFSFNDYVPPMDRHVSLQFATAAGLALRGL